MNPKYLNTVRNYIMKDESTFIKAVADELNIDIKEVSIDTVRMTNHDKGIIEIKHYIRIQDEDQIIIGHTVI